MHFLKTVAASFYSIAMYRELRHKPGRGLAYSFKVILLTLCVGSIVVLPVLNSMHQLLFVGKNGQLPLLDDVLLQIAEQTPQMTFENNTLTTQQTGAHVIRIKAKIGDKTEEKDIITIDTTGKTTSGNMQTPVLITSSSVISKMPDPSNENQEEKIETQTFEELMQNRTSTEKRIIDKQVAKEAAKDFAVLVHENLKMFYTFMTIVTVLMLVITLYIMRVVMVALLALAGMVIANTLRTKASFDQLMLLAAVSFTPVALLSAVIPLIGHKTVNSPTLFGLGVIMLGVVLYVTRDESPAA